MTTTLSEEASRATLPGRLGHPELELRTDPRSDPRMVAALAPFGMDTAAAPPPIDGTAALETRLEFCATAEIGFEALFDALMTGLPEISGLTRSTETIQGVDGDQIQLFIARPADARGPLPCVLHIHGGGMVIMRAANAAYVRVREELAATGVVVIGVEYRNGAGVLGNYPFPAGLNDCASALNWVHSHRDQLRITTVTVAGESGGGNLALATTLKAKQDRRLHMIDGVYAMVPYISGAYGWSEADRARELPSLVENDRYFSPAPTLRSWRRFTTLTVPTIATRCAGRTTPHRLIWRICLRTSLPSTNSTRCATRGSPTTANCCTLESTLLAAPCWAPATPRT